MLATVLSKTIVPALVAAGRAIATFAALSVGSQVGVLAIAAGAFLLWVYWDRIVNGVKQYTWWLHKSNKETGSAEDKVSAWSVMFE